MSDLDDFLEQEPVEAEPEVEQAPDVEAEAEPETAEQEEAPAAPEEPPKQSEPKTVPLSALMGKEAELKELKARLSELESQKKEEIDIFDDPDGYKKMVLTEAQQMALNTKFDTSEMLMRDKHEDYDKRAEQFEAMVSQDPSLFNQMVQSPHPAKFIYDHVVKTEQMKQFDSIDDYKAQIRAEIEAELEAKYAKSKPDVPPTMVNARSTSAPKPSDFNASLDDILK